MCAINSAASCLYGAYAGMQISRLAPHDREVCELWERGGWMVSDLQAPDRATVVRILDEQSN